MPKTRTKPKKRAIKRAKNGVRASYVEEPTTRTRKTLTPADRTEVQEKQDKALELRMSGATYKEIAGALGYANPSSAQKAVNRSIRRTKVDAAKEVVAMDLALMDEFRMRCLHSLRTNGDLHQIDRIMRIMEFKYRLLGITDETVRSLQSEHGITTVNNKNQVMVVMPSPETEDEFIRKMMGAVGVDPDSPEAIAHRQKFAAQRENHKLPMLEGSANETKNVAAGHTQLDEDVVEAEWTE